MDDTTSRRLETRARVIKAMAHPTRLFLVETLERGERCVCELTEMLDVDVSTVSRHLRVMRDVGILASERRGQQIFYSLRAPCVLGFFGCIEGVLNSHEEEAPSCGC